MIKDSGPQIVEIDQSKEPEHIDIDGKRYSQRELWEDLAALAVRGSGGSRYDARPAMEQVLAARQLPKQGNEPSFYHDIGSYLFSILDGEIQERFLSGEQVRLVVREPANSPVEGLPWELLCIPEQPNGFLALNDCISIVRCAGSDLLRGAAVSQRQLIPLKVCPVAVQPEYPNGYQFSEVNLLADLRNGVYSVLPDGTCDDPILRPDHRRLGFDRGDLGRLLQDREPTIVHLMAHGIGPNILFANEHGKPEPVNGAELGGVLAKLRDARVVVLGICGGAKREQQWGISAKLAALVSASSSVSWVIACRVPLSSKAVQAFFPAFYRAIFGRASVEEAVVQGRIALKAAGDWTFGNIACYLQSKSQGQLCFAARADKESSSVERPQTKASSVILDGVSDVQTRHKPNERLVHYDILRTYFTGADAIRREFTASLGKAKTTKRLWVIHGLPGTGKSSLLYMLLGQTKKRRFPLPAGWASIDDEKSAADILHRWAEDLCSDEVMLPTFVDLYRRHRFVRQVGEDVQRLTSIAAGNVVIQQDLLRQRGIREEIDVELFYDPTERLTEAFIFDICNIAQKQRIVLLLDTFEQIGPLEDWTSDIARRLPSNSILVIAGQREPRWERRWPTWKAKAARHELKPLTEADIRTLVSRFYASRRSDRPRPEHLDAVVRFARGLPLVATSMVELWIDYDMSMDDLPTVEAQGVTAFVERLLESVPKNIVPMLEAAAIVRGFNKSVLRAVTGIADVDESFAKLRGFPFVRERSRELRSLHDAVREKLDASVLSDDKERHTALHRHALKYYEEQLSAANGEETEWLVLERLYHQTVIDERSGLELFIQCAQKAVDNRLVNRLRSLIKDINSYSLMDEASKKWRDYYNARLAHLEAHINEAVHTYQAIGYDETAEPKIRAYALCDLGEILLSLEYVCKPQGMQRAMTALQSYRRLAVEMDSKLVHALSHQTFLYHMKGDWATGIDLLKDARQWCAKHNDVYGELYTDISIFARDALMGDWAKLLSKRSSLLDELRKLPGSTFLRYRALSETIWALAWMGRLHEAELTAREAMSIGADFGTLSLEGCQRHLGYTLGMQGRFEEGSRLIEESLCFLRDFPSRLPSREAITYGFYGHFLLIAGKLEIADGYLQRGLKMKQDLMDTTGVPEILVWLGQLKCFQNDWSSAEDFFRQCLTFECRRWNWYVAALCGLAYVKHVHKEYAALPALVSEAEQIASQFEYNDHLALIRTLQGHVAWDGLVSAWDSGFSAVFQYYQQALIYALRFNRFLLDETLSGREHGATLRPIVPHCMARGDEGRRMLSALLDWWKTGMNDLGTFRSDTISPIPEGISLLDAERLAREREPGDELPQQAVTYRITQALSRLGSSEPRVDARQ